jgi:uncharacterized membrane protein
MSWLSVVTLINLILDMALKRGVPLAMKLWAEWQSDIDGMPTDEQIADLREIINSDEYFKEHGV